MALDNLLSFGSDYFNEPEEAFWGLDWAEVVYLSIWVTIVFGGAYRAGWVEVKKSEQPARGPQLSSAAGQSPGLGGTDTAWADKFAIPSFWRSSFVVGPSILIFSSILVFALCMRWVPTNWILIGSLWTAMLAFMGWRHTVDWIFDELICKSPDHVRRIWRMCWAGLSNLRRSISW
jgi:hypothetical protein